MSMPDYRDICEVTEIEDSAFDEFYQANISGIAFIPETHQDSKDSVMSSDTGDFAKWIDQNRPELNVEVGAHDKKRLLRSFDIFLPLAFLAQETALQLYLTLVAEYVRYKTRGLLRGESSRVELTAVYKDKKEGITKKFEFAGDVENLEKVIKALTSSND